uniref:40S ribosomal protein S15 n=1 Tax=Heterorhabditis bacteriophora TaxID=37862 RepID=A0A1I7WAB3_HETBA
MPQPAFSRYKSPIWMDSTTEVQCREMEDAVRGPESSSLLFFILVNFKRCGNLGTSFWNYSEVV